MKKGMGEIARWVIIIVIILIAVFLVWKYKDLFFGEKVVKVENCGDLDSQNLRNDCCSVKFQDQPHIQCVGNWEFVNNECKFVCA